VEWAKGVVFLIDLFGNVQSDVIAFCGNDYLSRGKIQEFIACSHLSMQGLIVHLVGDAMGYDIIVDSGGKLHRVNVKSSNYREGNAMIFNTRVGRGGLKSTARPVTDECDFLALVKVGSLYPVYSKPDGKFSARVPCSQFNEECALYSLNQCLYG
jgi:hypothetical protein